MLGALGFLIYPIGLAVFAGGLFLLHKLKPQEEQLYDAHFAQEQEHNGLRFRQPPAESLLICQDEKKRIYAVTSQPGKEVLGNTITLGPTQSGKSVALKTQTLHWPFSLVILDIKGDVTDQTAGYRSGIGKVFFIDPGGRGHRYDPFHDLTKEDDLKEAAKAIMYTRVSNDFADRATTQLTCLFKAATIEKQPLLPYVRAITRLGPKGAGERLHYLDPSLATDFLFAPFPQVNWDDRYLSSTWGVLLTKLSLLLSDDILRTFSACDFTPSELMLSSQPVTAYLKLPEDQLDSLAPLTRLMSESILKGLLRTYDERRGKGCKPVLLMMDEAARTAIPSLVKYAATCVGRRVYLWIVVQDRSQLFDTYHEGANTIMANCMTHLYYRPKDLATSKYLSEYLGLVSRFGKSEHLREGEVSSEGRSETGVPLMTPDQIRTMPLTDVLAFFDGTYPIRAKRLNWWDHDTLNSRFGLPLPPIQDLPPLPVFDLSVPPGDDGNGGDGGDGHEGYRI